MKRSECDVPLSDEADGSVEAFQYDYVYHNNNKPLNATETDFMHFFSSNSTLCFQCLPCVRGGAER